MKTKPNQTKPKSFIWLWIRWLLPTTTTSFHAFLSLAHFCSEATGLWAGPCYAHLSSQTLCTCRCLCPQCPLPLGLSLGLTEFLWEASSSSQSQALSSCFSDTMFFSFWHLILVVICLNGYLLFIGFLIRPYVLECKDKPAWFWHHNPNC